MSDFTQKAREIAAAIAGELYSVTLAKKVDDLATRLIAAALSEASRAAAERERAQCVEICNSFREGCVKVAREAAGSFDADLLYEVSTAIASTCDEIAALVNAAPRSATEPPA